MGRRVKVVAASEEAEDELNIKLGKFYLEDRRHDKLTVCRKFRKTRILKLMNCFRAPWGFEAFAVRL